MSEAPAEPQIIGRPITLTANSWQGDPPAVGDLIGTRKGRYTYEVIGVSTRSRRIAYRLRCLRLPRGSEPPGRRFFEWTWARRG